MLLFVAVLPLCDTVGVAFAQTAKKAVPAKKKVVAKGKTVSKKYVVKKQQPASKMRIANKKKKAPVKPPVKSYYLGPGQKTVLNITPQVKRVVVKQKGRRIVKYQKVMPPVPISATYNGIDISHHQHLIDWDSVRALNIQFVYIKATEGETFHDSLYSYNVSRARAAGFKVGSYLYFHPDMSAAKQFEQFRTFVHEENQDLVPMVDVEETGGLSRAVLVKRLNELLDIMTAYYGQRPVLYSATSYYNTYLHHEFPNYKFFMAGYTRKPELSDGKDYVVWQFSSKGKVDGIDCNVDLDVFTPGHSIADLLFDHSKFKPRKQRLSPVLHSTSQPGGLEHVSPNTLKRLEEKPKHKRR